jgi:hypothetical protein
MLYYDPAAEGVLRCMWDSCKNRATSQIFNSDATDSSFLCITHKKAAEINLQKYDRIRAPESGRRGAAGQRPGEQQPQLAKSADAGPKPQQRTTSQSSNRREKKAEVAIDVGNTDMPDKKIVEAVKKIEDAKTSTDPPKRMPDIRSLISALPKPKT